MIESLAGLPGAQDAVAHERRSAIQSGMGIVVRLKEERRGWQLRYRDKSAETRVADTVTSYLVHGYSDEIVLGCLGKAAEYYDVDITRYRPRGFNTYTSRRVPLLDEGLIDLWRCIFGELIGFCASVRESCVSVCAVSLFFYD
jgi:hypothetical protein